MAQRISTDTLIIGIAAAWSLALPYFPDALFHLLDSLIGAFLLLLVVVLLLPQGVVPGVIVVAAVALTFVERNRRKIGGKLQDLSYPTLQQQLAPSPPMSDQEVHPAYEVPPTGSEEDTSFFPEGDASDRFEAVAPSMDEKQAIPTISSNTDTAERFYIRNAFAKTDLE